MFIYLIVLKKLLPLNLFNEKGKKEKYGFNLTTESVAQPLSETLCFL